MLRVFHDRLVDDEDRSWFQGTIKRMVDTHMGLKFDKVFMPPAGSNTPAGDVSVLRSVLFCDFLTQV
jgi:dynein heavy chain